MKKFVCIFTIIAMLISVFVIPASANIYNDIPETEYKYHDRVKEYVGVYAPDTPDLYREFYYYSDINQEEPDWVLIVCQVVPEPWNKKSGAIVGDRILWTIAGSGIGKFSTGFAVYIPKKDTFIELNNNNIEQIITECPNFIETIEEEKFGMPLGDADDNGILNIIDATYIQRYIANKYDYYDYFSKNLVLDSGSSDDFYVCDYDCDREVTVMDATEIQRHLAGIK